MNAMGHGIPNAVGVDQTALDERLQKVLPGYMSMGQNGMYEHALHAEMGHMKGPENTLPMATGQGPFGPIGMGGMFAMVKIREQLSGRSDPGWYDSEQAPRARQLSAASEDSSMPKDMKMDMPMPMPGGGSTTQK